jgi:hypothetical protein
MTHSFFIPKKRAVPTLNSATLQRQKTSKFSSQFPHRNNTLTVQNPKEKINFAEREMGLKT